MSPRELSRPRHTECAGTMEMDECAGPSAQFRVSFFLCILFLFKCVGVWGGRHILKKDQPELGVK